MADQEVVKATQGVLDAMTKGVFELRGAKTLTPLGLERGGVPDVPEVFLTNEAIRDIAVDIRRQIETLTAVADGLDRLTQSRTATDDTPAADPQKEVERAADAKFAAQFVAQQAEAQAATFTAPAAPATDGEAVCPTHGEGKTRKMMGGKTIRVCTTCNWREDK